MNKPKTQNSPEQDQEPEYVTFHWLRSCITTISMTLCGDVKGPEHRTAPLFGCYKEAFDSFQPTAVVYTDWGIAVVVVIGTREERAQGRTAE